MKGISGTKAVNRRNRERLQFALELIESGRVKISGTDPEGRKITKARRIEELRARLAKSA